MGVSHIFGPGTSIIKSGLEIEMVIEMKRDGKKRLMICHFNLIDSKGSVKWDHSKYELEEVEEYMRWDWCDSLDIKSMLVELKA